MDLYCKKNKAKTGVKFWEISEPHYEFSVIDAKKQGISVRTESPLNQVDLDENPVLAWS